MPDHDVQKIAVLVTPTSGRPAQPREVRAEMVAPGLAIAPAFRYGQKVSSRWSLVHTPSGRHLSGKACCRGCVEEAAKRAVASGVDWSRSEVEVRADESAKALHEKLFAAGLALSCDGEECG
jgi:hypothetical protein